MSLSPIKQEILESMLLSDKPQKATDIAKNAHKAFQPVMMHLLGLTRMGYIAVPEKGSYNINKSWKESNRYTRSHKGNRNSNPSLSPRMNKAF